MTAIADKYSFAAVDGCVYRYDYARICADLNAAARAGDERAEISIIREACLHDLFFLIYFVLDIKAINKPWVVARVYECQDCHTDVLDLWAREHFKSTILTFALPIWQVLRNPEERIAIISHTRSIAKAFLQRIKVTLESNELLIKAFPDVLYFNPDKESPKWALDMGLVCRRKGNYMEATFEAWGIIDGMPAGKHFTGRVYDDLVTDTSVSTPEQIAKTKYAYEMSHNIGAAGGWFRMIGTIYHFADLYMSIIEDGTLSVRKYPCRDAAGHGVLYDDEYLSTKRKHMGAYVWACQMMLDPVANDNQVFRPEWMRFFKGTSQKLNYYIIVDPASKKKHNSDFTTMWVIGVDSGQRRYYVDCVHDRLSLKERWTKLKELVMKWTPMNVGYEEYGLQADIEYIEEKQEAEGVLFQITPLGGLTSKEERIRRLVPYMEEGKCLFPRQLKYKMTSGEEVDLISVFIKDEYLRFPYSKHDDMLDCAARILDDKLNVQFPHDSRIKKFFQGAVAGDVFAELEDPEESWMGL